VKPWFPVKRQPLHQSIDASQAITINLPSGNQPLAGWKIPELNGCFKGKTIEVNGGLSIGFMNHLKPIETTPISFKLCKPTISYTPFKL